MENNFKTYLFNCADGHCIYVLGAQGKVLSDMTDDERYAYYLRMENGNEANALADAAEYSLKVIQGFDYIQGFDCSGLIMHFLQDIVGEFDYDTTAQGLYNLCAYHPTINELQPFDLVFIYKPEQNRITHCGVYIGNGEVIESRRIGNGVQITQFDQRPWNRYGHLTQLEKYLPADEHPELAVTKPMIKGEHIKALQAVLNMYNFDCGKEDGKFGKKTANALAEFCKYYREV